MDFEAPIMKNICLVTIDTPDMSQLADMTWRQNKLPYCARHDYDFRRRVHNEPLGDNSLAKKPMGLDSWPYAGFDKILYVEKVMSENRHDWIAWFDCDTLVTNFSVTLESIITQLRPCTVFAVTADHAAVNGGVFLIKNDEVGKSYLSYLKSRMYETAASNEYLFGEEQTAMIESVKDPQFSSVIEVLPQRTMNSYPYHLYGRPADQKDQTGHIGNWLEKDFVIHIPGFGPDLYQDRLRHFSLYLPLVSK